MTVRASFPAHAAVVTALLAIAAGCGDEPPPLPTPLPPATVAPATAAPPTAEATATTAVSATLGPSELPADGELPVVQLARIDHSPWEPALLAQMTPHFSLQANGRIVFSHPGPDRSGWYQSSIAPEDARRFVRALVDEIDVLGLAERHSAEPVTFAVGADGAAVGCKATGVVFVRTATRAGRLVMSECDINAPKPGPDAAKIVRLKQIVNMVQLWKEGVNQALAPEFVAGVTSLLGWWTDTRVPYSPASAVAFVSAPPPGLPADAPRTAWPLEQAVTDTLKADFGERPGELLLGVEEADALIAAARAAFGTPYGPRAWGPLFTNADGAAMLVGVRPAVPGGNEVVLEPYVYHAPPRGYAPAAP